MRQRILHFLKHEHRPSADPLAEEEIAALIIVLSDPAVALTDRESRVLKAASGLTEDELLAMLSARPLDSAG